MNSHWLRAEREMSQIGRGSLNFRHAIGEMNFRYKKYSHQPTEAYSITWSTWNLGDVQQNLILSNSSWKIHFWPGTIVLNLFDSWLVKKSKCEQAFYRLFIVILRILLLLFRCSHQMLQKCYILLFVYSFTDKICHGRIWAHMGAYGRTWAHFSTFDNMSPWAHMGAYGRILALLLKCALGAFYF